MAFQNPTLLPWQRTLDNVLLPLEIVQPHKATFRRDRGKHIARAEALLATVGLKGSPGNFWAAYRSARASAGR